MARVIATQSHANRSEGSVFSLPDEVAAARAEAGLVRILDTPAPAPAEAPTSHPGPAPAEAIDEEDDHA